MADKSGSLEEYRSKREFSRTPEPDGSQGAPKARASGRVFCVQQHLASHLHYDFRLEHRGVLLSWAVPKGPSLNPRNKRLAMMTEDHPIDYGDFEGVIPEGYGMGVVMLWDRGEWVPMHDDLDEAIERGQIKFELRGVKLKGQWALVRTAGGKYSSPRGDHAWLFIKHRDKWAGEVDVLSAAPLSVSTSRDMGGILLDEMPKEWLSPQTDAELKTKVPKQLKTLIERIKGQAKR